jgi:hypothetical protein
MISGMPSSTTRPLDGHWFQEAKNVIVQVSLSLKELTCSAPILRTHEMITGFD